jgi:hypothetical protein
MCTHQSCARTAKARGKLYDFRYVSARISKTTAPIRTKIGDTFGTLLETILGGFFIFCSGDNDNGSAKRRANQICFWNLLNFPNKTATIALFQLPNTN